MVLSPKQNPCWLSFWAKILYKTRNTPNAGLNLDDRAPQILLLKWLKMTFACGFMSSSKLSSSHDIHQPTTESYRIYGIEQIYVSFHSKDVSGFVWFSPRRLFTLQWPHQFPKNCLPTTVAWKKPNAPSGQLQWLSDFTDLQHRARLEGLFFFWKGHLITRIGADAKWGVIDRQISYQIKNLYPKNILYNPLHHWTFLDIRMSELFWTHRVLFVSVLRCGPPESINLLVPNWVKKKWGLFMYGRGFKSSYNSAVLMPDGFKPSWNMFKHMDTSIIVNI